LERLVQRLRLLTVLLISLCMACSGGNGDRQGAEKATLVVFAAASTTDVVNELAGTYAHARLKASFGASSTLARQINDGAPADVYLSASRKWVDYLKESDALVGEPVVFARNTLVCIVSRNSALAAEDAAGLRGELSGNDKVAIADEGVPAGDYARQSLAATGDLEALRPWMVGQKDVRAVLRAVESGECAAGFVYATDLRGADVHRLFTFNPETYEPIRYFVAAVKGGQTELGHRFIAYLAGEQAHEILTRAGFALP
jgi:molybdate transport system substrate-binding protein